MRVIKRRHLFGHCVQNAEAYQGQLAPEARGKKQPLPQMFFCWGVGIKVAEHGSREKREKGRFGLWLKGAIVVTLLAKHPCQSTPQG